MKKKIRAPFVSQGCISKNDRTQGRAFREAAENFRLKTVTVRPGKGQHRRWRQVSDAEFDANWERIFGKGK